MQEFVEVGSPTDDEVQALLQAITTRLMKMLTRRSVLVCSNACSASSLGALASMKLGAPSASQRYTPFSTRQ